MLVATKEKWYKQLCFGDFFVYLFIIIISILLLFSFPAKVSKMQATTPLQAQVLVDGQEILTLNEEELQMGGSKNFEAYGYHYVIDYGDGKIRFAEADCPDQVCVKTGWLQKGGRLAACVPGHVLLRLDGQSDLFDKQSDSDEVDLIVK